jgi:hypothetical protein
LSLLGQLGDRLGPDKELVRAQVFDRLDVEGFLELLGVSVGEALQCLDRCFGQVGSGADIKELTSGGPCTGRK